MNRDYAGYLTPKCIDCPHWIDDSWGFGCSSVNFQECIKPEPLIEEPIIQRKYSYHGPVMIFGQCVDTHWKAVTVAVSEKKALNNLAYRWKMSNGYGPHAKVSLPGRITLIS